MSIYFMIIMVGGLTYFTYIQWKLEKVNYQLTILIA